MIFVIVIVALFTMMTVLCCAAVVNTPYDRRIDDEKQEEFLRDIRKVIK